MAGPEFMPRTRGGARLGRFEPEYVGKLNFYVQLVDDHLRD